MFYVYVLYSKKLDSKYVGFTKDIKRRLKDHNSGQGEYTSKGKPWKLIYLEMFISERDARKEELYLKTGSGRNRLKYLLKETLKF